jgi:nucleoside-diphosphate kinase
MSRTLIIVKPDGVERALVGEIVRRFEAKGLVLRALELRQVDEGLARQHYAEHEGRDYFEPLVQFITRGPSVVGVLDGPDDVCALVRSMVGKTNPLEAVPGSIRGDFALSTRENLVHASDSNESAQREIALFFPNLV